ALIALPTVAYAGRPFFASAWAALRQGRASMDLPISVGVTLVTVMSLVETIRGGEHAYFDSAAALLFFLLIGRTMDHLARRRARIAAEQLIALRAVTVMVIDPDDSVRPVAAEAVEAGWRMQVASGERIGVDGVVLDGLSFVDQSLITGESLPRPIGPGDQVYAGSLNLGAPLTLRATASGEGTVLAECVRLIEAAEGKRGRFVGLSDRVARLYAPIVHLAALITCLVWRFALDASWSEALLNAAAVLIITCPCALALAVPAVQVITAGRLFRRGILLKSPTALERLASVTLVAFDKTGTLSEPEFALRSAAGIDATARAQAASLAAASRHPLARALLRAQPIAGAALKDVKEIPGSGVEGTGPEGVLRLGSAAFCGVDQPRDSSGPALWLARPNQPAIRFDFVERARCDAAATVTRLRDMGLALRALSGDRPAAVGTLVNRIGIGQWQANCTPLDKVAAIESLAAAGQRVLMVGDGLNDGPALAAALVSMSPSTAQDISQNAADVVFQGDKLAPVADVLLAARHAKRLIRWNIIFSILYNALFLPAAVMGLVTPWLAAAAMSSSSIIVLANSFRKPRD
ncbi:MAG: heavy metal translocating P-type ATPase, partial [Elsteraceae bacterium]